MLCSLTALFCCPKTLAALHKVTCLLKLSLYQETILTTADQKSVLYSPLQLPNIKLLLHDFDFGFPFFDNPYTTSHPGLPSCRALREYHEQHFFYMLEICRLSNYPDNSTLLPNSRSEKPTLSWKTSLLFYSVQFTRNAHSPPSGRMTQSIRWKRESDGFTS